MFNYLFDMVSMDDKPWIPLVATGLLLLTFGVQLVAVIVQSFTYRSVHRSHGTHECDRMFLEIQKMTIMDPDCLRFYDLCTAKGDASGFYDYWTRLDSRQKKCYMLAELNYFLFAFTFQQFRERRVQEGYWQIYSNWLDTLLKYNPFFQAVCEYEAEYYEAAFGKEVARRKASIQQGTIAEDVRRTWLSNMVELVIHAMNDVIKEPHYYRRPQHGTHPVS